MESNSTVQRESSGPLSPSSLIRHSVVVSFPLIGTVAALYIWLHGYGPGMIELSLLLCFYVLNIIGMEIGYHRYFAHRSFKARKSVRIALAVLGSLSYVGPLMWWVAIHRLHHKHCDQPGDPHSPQLTGNNTPLNKLKGIYHGHIGWLFNAQCARPEHWNRYALDLYKDPVLFRIHLAYDYWLVLGILLPAIIGGILHLSMEGFLLGALWGGAVRIFLATNSIWAVNSLGHSVGGRQHFKRGSDQSRNHFWLAIITLGAGWHNNHHAFPYYATTSFKKWQIDISGWIIALLEKSGLIWDVRKPDFDKINQRLMDKKY